MGTHSFVRITIQICYMAGILMLANNMMAQPKSRTVYAPSPRKNANSITVIDTAYWRISYAFNADTIHDLSTYIDCQCLEIGNSTSKYYSRFLNDSDSLVTLWLKEHPKAGSLPRWLGEKGKNASYWTEYQYSEIFRSKDKYTVYVRMPAFLKRYDCYYVEKIPQQEWQLYSETLEVCGFVCQKAICFFRGREFVAWFTTEIPLSEGPWVFGGLPGLIIKLYDKDRLYVFECIQIEQGKFPIKKYCDYKNYKKMSRHKVLDLQRKINENYFRVAHLRNAYTKQPVSRFTPYEPLELE